MQKILKALQDAVAKEPIVTQDLGVARELLKQVEARLGLHAIAAEKIVQHQTQQKAAQVAEAAKIVQAAEQEKAAEAQALEQQAQSAASETPAS